MDYTYFSFPDESESSKNAAEPTALPPDKMLQYKVGMWVLVKYDEETYPGQVVEVESESTVKVNVMHRSGMYFKWPEKEDSIFYEVGQIVRTIDPPIVYGLRGQFTFNCNSI